MTRGAIIDGAVFDAQRDADRIRREAEEQSSLIVERAVAEAEALRQKAIAEGREHGKADAAALLIAARRDAASLRESARADLIALSARMAERIMGHALAVDPKLVNDVCGEALKELRRTRAATLRLHPDDVAIVQNELPRLRSLCEGADLNLVQDASIARGGCVVSTDSADVDARIESQLRMLERALSEK